MTDPIDLIEQRLEHAGTSPKRKGDTITARCPAHADRNPSLSVGRGSRRDIVIKCHAGCAANDVMHALGIDWTELSDQHHANGHTEVATYTYEDVSGRPLYRVHRGIGKKFWQEHLTVHGEWVKGLADTPRVLYHLPDVVAAVQAGTPIWVCEGEKDVDRMRDVGVVATCNSGGAGKFLDTHADVLAGATVAIVADRDQPGLEHATSVRDKLQQRGCTVTVVRALTGKDAYDHLVAGHTIDQFVTINPDTDTDDDPVDAWDDPTPLGGDIAPTPFPLDAVPQWISDMAEDVAAEVGVPVDLPATIAIAALSAACAKQVTIHVRGTWTEPVNLYLVTALAPGAGKSPAFKAMTKPLRDWEIDRRADVEGQRSQLEQNLRMVEKSRQRAEDKGDVTEARALLEEARAIRIPPIPRLIADDATPEALVALLAEQGGRLALMSSEGGLFDMITGRYSKDANLDPYLMAWSGDPIIVDRIGRGSLTIPNPHLTVGLTVQPAVIERLAMRPELAGRGLTARFMYSVPPDIVGERDMVSDHDTDHAARHHYNTTLSVIVGRYTAGDTSTLTLADDARRRFLTWLQQLEHRRRPGEDLYDLREWSTKLQSSVARLTALLAVAGGHNDSQPIPDKVVADAITIGDYWIDHAKIVHGMWSSNDRLAGARIIWDWLKQTKATTFSVRDLYRAKQRRFEKPDDLAGPLELLTECGYIRPMFTGPLIVGKRGVDSPKYTVHPSSQHVRNNHVNVVNVVTRDISETSLSLYKNEHGLNRVDNVDNVDNCLSADGHGPEVEPDPLPCGSPHTVVDVSNHPDPF